MTAGQRRQLPMPTILFTDDNKHIREYCQHELEDEGYRVILAGNGAEAIERFVNDSPDLVVLDIHMPIVNGLEAAERIKAVAPDIPVVLFTSFDDACLTDQRSQLAAACVEKSEDLTELKRVLATSLASRRHCRTYRVGLPPATAAGDPGHGLAAS
jgi:CheY-like chemotaxis protein